MEHIQHELVQGSPEWHQFRLDHYGASESTPMLGLSKNITRSELLRAKHTGIAKDFSDWEQTYLLDHGHAVEAMARPMAEEILGEELYPSVYSYGKLSASTDGITIDGKTAFEHKQPNAALVAAVSRGELPEEHQPQCQQTMLVTGAERVLFMGSGATPENCGHIFVKRDPIWFERIQAGWAQFAIDLQNYQYVEVKPTANGAPIKELPALIVQVEGRVVSSNLVAFKAAATLFIGQINTDLQTDQDFADAEKTVKFCKEGEERLDLVKAQALPQTSTIDELFRTVDQVSAELRSKRLELDRLVKIRKESIRVEIVQEGKNAFIAHISILNKRLGRPYVTLPLPDFAAWIRGKKTISSLRDAVDTALARAKIDSNAIADKMQINLNALRSLGEDYSFLFADLQQIVGKDNDDFTALVKVRIADHKAAEQKRLDEERERIRVEEQRKATAEAEAKVRQEQAAKDTQEREARLQEEAKTKAATDAKEAEERRLRAEREAAEAKETADRRAKEESERKERLVQQARDDAAVQHQRETLRQEAEQDDARTLLATFVERFGNLKEFAAIVAAIRALPVKQKKAA